MYSDFYRAIMAEHRKEENDDSDDDDNVGIAIIHSKCIANALQLPSAVNTPVKDKKKAKAVVVVPSESVSSFDIEF